MSGALVRRLRSVRSRIDEGAQSEDQDEA